MTQTNEENTPKPSKKKSPESGSAASKTAKPEKGDKGDKGDKKALAGYAHTFANWEVVPVEPGPIEIDPKKLLVIFDVRATLQSITDFVPQCVGGILQPVRITKVKYLGENADLPVSPEPKTLLSLKKGAEYYVLVYGRRRVRAALQLGFQTIKAELATYTRCLDMVPDAYIENEARTPAGQYDRAVTIKQLRDAGMLHDEITSSLKFKPGIVSQSLGVFECGEATQKLFAAGSLTLIHIRALRPMKDHDAQGVLATRAAERGWSEDQIKEAVKQYNARQEAAAEGAQTPGGAPKVKRVVDYDKAEILFAGQDKLRPALNFFATKVKQVRAKAIDENDVEARVRHAKKLGHQEGILEGLQMSAGLKEIPAAALMAEEPEAPAADAAADPAK